MTDRGWEKDFADYFAARAVPLRRLAYALCGDWHLAEDLMQGTFLKLYRRWSGIHAETLDAYARRILVNAYLSTWRSRRREWVMADVPDHAVADAEVGDVIDVRRAIAALPPRQRVLIVLRYLEDASVADTAELMGISEGAVKSQTARAAQKLRAVLGSRTPARR